MLLLPPVMAPATSSTQPRRYAIGCAILKGDRSLRELIPFNAGAQNTLLRTDTDIQPGVTDLADTLGLISVRTNRILQGFRRDELITLDRRRLALRNIERLQAISGFTSDYLKLKSAPPEVLRFVDDLEHNRGGRANPQDV
jgi:Crp-like helix-turn-helix domain